MRRGQALFEILIALGIGTVLIVGALGFSASTVRNGGIAQKMQGGGMIAKELLDNARVTAESDWHKVLALSTSTKYYVTTTSVPYAFTAGTETIMNASTAYTRYFMVSDVQRLNGAIVTSGGTYDPSTKLFSVYYSWPQNATYTISLYVARSFDYSLSQADWSGGSGQQGVVAPNTKFASATPNINTTTTVGAIKLNLQ